MQLAKRLQLIKPSPTLMVTVQVAALRRQGIEVIDFGAGDFTASLEELALLRALPPGVARRRGEALLALIAAAAASGEMPPESSGMPRLVSAHLNVYVRPDSPVQPCLPKKNKSMGSSPNRIGVECLSDTVNEP